MSGKLWEWYGLGLERWKCRSGNNIHENRGTHPGNVELTDQCVEDGGLESVATKVQGEAELTEESGRE